MRNVSVGIATLAGMLALPAGALSAVIVDPSITLTQEATRVEAREHLRYDYQLTANSELVFDFRTSRWRRDALRLWLLDEVSYRNWRSGRTFTSFSPSPFVTKRGGRLHFTAPRTGLYYVILDNREASSPKELSVYAYVNLPVASEEDEQTRRVYQSFYRELQRLLEFQEFDIRVTRCGQVNAYAMTDVVICKELDELLMAGPTDGLRLFVLMHEIAHSFLFSWGYRTVYSDQVLTDRLAATLIEMMDRRRIAVEAAEWLQLNNSFTGLPGSDGDLAIGKARARRVAEWLIDEDQLDLLWTRRILFPRMHSAALSAIAEERNLEDRTRRRIERELMKRNDEGQSGTAKAQGTNAARSGRR